MDPGSLVNFFLNKNRTKVQLLIKLSQKLNDARYEWKYFSTEWTELYLNKIWVILLISKFVSKLTQKLMFRIDHYFRLLIFLYKWNVSIYFMVLVI